MEVGGKIRLDRISVLCTDQLGAPCIALSITVIFTRQNMVSSSFGEDKAATHLNWYRDFHNEYHAS